MGGCISALLLRRRIIEAEIEAETRVKEKIEACCPCACERKALLKKAEDPLQCSLSRIWDK